MTVDRREILMAMYRAFNERDIEGATEFLAPEVDWPNELTGRRERGRLAVRRYWQQWWQDADPRVEPLAIEVEDTGQAHVRVHEFIRSRQGAILEDRKVVHIHTFDGAFITRMNVIAADDDDPDDGDGADS